MNGREFNKNLRKKKFIFLGLNFYRWELYLFFIELFGLLVFPYLYKNETVGPLPAAGLLGGWTKTD
jgi:hypothetical protein